MLVNRCFAWSLLAAGGLALVLTAEPGFARQPKDELPKPPPNILNFKDNAGSDLNRAKAAFATFAKYNADFIAHPRVYSTPQEFVPPKGPPVPTTESLIADMSRSIIVPLPGGPVGVDQADYIRELGTALDTELKVHIERSSVPVVRVNATRMLAAACKSGAQIHWPTVTGLITNANTPAEVKYYAYQAAGNLLAAYDLNDYQSRKHAHKPKEVSDLIAALQAAITKPGTILPAPPMGAALEPDQADVLTFIRRQAIRALGQVRFSDKVPGGPDLYPGFTLAQVATADPAIIPPPTETEIAEAVIGLCNMAPPARSAEKEPFAYAMGDAVLTGITTFATRRAASPLDKTLAWRSYGGRLSDALKGWRPLFDPAFNPAKPNVYSPASIPKVVEAIAAEAENRVLSPMYEAGTVNVNALKQYRDNTLRGDKKWSLSPFVTNPKLTLTKRI
jgi:hypothetical protein